MKSNTSMIVEALHKSWPMVKIASVMYATAIGTLWGAVRVLSPEANEFSFLRGVGAALVMTLAGNSLQSHLGPSVGQWFLPVKLLLDVVVVKISFTLPWRQAMLVGAVYFGVIMGVHYLYIQYFGHPVVMHQIKLPHH